MMLVSCGCLCGASRRAIGLSSGRTLPHVAIATRGSTAARSYVACIIPVILPLLHVLELQKWWTTSADHIWRRGRSDLEYFVQITRMTTYAITMTQPLIKKSSHQVACLLSILEDIILQQLILQEAASCEYVL